MKKALIFVFCALVAYSGYQFFDKGFRRTITSGEFYGIKIGTSKEAVLDNIATIDHVSAIVVDGKTILFSKLDSVPLRDRSNDEGWIELLSSSKWEFSPNVGHKYFWLHFK